VKQGRGAINRVSTIPQPVSRLYPAEWEKQSTVWLSCPHNEKEWGKKRLDGIKQFYVELINKILDFQNVNLIFTSEELLHKAETYHGMSQQAQQKKNKLKKVIIPNNDIWIRDYGPFFLEVKEGKRKKPLVLDFEFNAWGGKFPPWELDNNLPKGIALFSGLEIESYPIILEGGALEFSGDGIILTTEECLLNKNRNKDLSKEQTESILKSAFNTEEVIWLERGLANDHTDGHIDNVARFIGQRKVLICKSSNKKEKNFPHLLKSTTLLKEWKHPKKGYRLEVIEIPLPEPTDAKIKDLPCSYANFIFVNGGIIVPTYNSTTDEAALKIFQFLFPDRKVIGIDCSLLIQEGGSIHCMTKQEPLL